MLSASASIPSSSSPFLSASGCSSSLLGLSDSSSSSDLSRTSVYNWGEEEDRDIHAGCLMISEAVHLAVLPVSCTPLDSVNATLSRSSPAYSTASSLYELVDPSLSPTDPPSSVRKCSTNSRTPISFLHHSPSVEPYHCNSFGPSVFPDPGFTAASTDRRNLSLTCHRSSSHSDSKKLHTSKKQGETKAFDTSPVGLHKTPTCSTIASHHSIEAKSIKPHMRSAKSSVSKVKLTDTLSYVHHYPGNQTQPIPSIAHTAERPASQIFVDSNNTKMVQTVVNQPTRIQHGKVKCLILDAPSNENLQPYVKEMLEYGVLDLVRTCEKTYDDEIVESAGIRVHEMVFPDGEAPSDAIIREWLDVVTHAMSAKGAVAVHCVAGLGRAPVLVAIALIEKGGLDPLDAIMFIRDRRKGAINRRQLTFLKNYKRRYAQKDCCCVNACTIM